MASRRICREASYHKVWGNWAIAKTTVQSSLAIGQMVIKRSREQDLSEKADEYSSL